MEKQPEFKKNLWGYDKEAVLKYIDEMSRQAAQSEAELQEKVSQIAHSREELEGQIAEFEQKLQHVSGALDTEKGKNKSLSDMIGLLQQEIDRQRRYSQSRDRDFQEMKEKNRELAGQIKNASDKSRKYDEAAASIGAAILQAQQAADQIIVQANSRAQEISRDTDQFLLAVLEKIDGMQQEFAFLRSRMNESIHLLNDRLDQIDRDLMQARDSVRQKAQSIREASLGKR